MAVGKVVSIFDEEGKTAVLGPGVWYCYDCSRKRKTIYYPFTGTIETPCSCGCETVFLME